jgi:peptidoglycan-N-acetylglucosamine deacetylase
MKQRPMSITTPLAAALLLGAMLGTDASVPPQTATGSEPTRAIVLTFDDLPYAAGGQPDRLPAAERVTTAILRVLMSHQAPAVAFVNESKLLIDDEVEARTALLKRWVDNGAILGNHTFSHADFNRLSIEEFQNEIVKGDIVSRRLMQGRQPYQLYFRHPHTHTGDTPEKKEAIEQFLAVRNYQVAPHTIDGSDFIFNVGYVRSLQADDQATADRLRGTYVDFVMAATEFADRIAPQIFGRPIPQTIVLHANDITADALDQILQRLEARGYRFITLDQAMMDPAYQTKDVLVTKSGPTWLWRWTKSKGQSVSFKADPEPPQWVMDLYASKGGK